MEKFGKVIVKLRIPILILSFLLLIPSAIGYFNTRVNYDILYYLPNEIETMQGQDILMDDFNKGAYAMVVVQNMDTKSTDRLIKKVENVDHVAQVISYTGIVGEDVPSEIVPSKFRKYFENDSTDTTLFAIFFDNFYLPLQSLAGSGYSGIAVYFSHAVPLQFVSNLTIVIFNTNITPFSAENQSAFDTI